MRVVMPTAVVKIKWGGEEFLEWEECGTQEEIWYIVVEDVRLEGSDNTLRDVYKDQVGDVAGLFEWYDSFLLGL